MPQLDVDQRRFRLGLHPLFLRLVCLLMWGSPIIRATIWGLGEGLGLGHLGGPNSKDYTFLGSLLGSPYFGKLPYQYSCGLPGNTAVVDRACTKQNEFTYVGCRTSQDSASFKAFATWLAEPPTRAVPQKPCNLQA